MVCGKAEFNLEDFIKHTSCNNGEKVIQNRTSVLRGTQMYEKFQPFLEKQKEEIADYCATKESLQKMVKYAPGVAKGIAFAGASITGYALGSILGKKIAEAVEENKQEKARIVSMNQNKEKEVNIAQKEYRQSA